MLTKMKLWQSRYNSQCKLSQQDLREISEQITNTYAPQETRHQAELVLMPVDPVNLYAYWNLKENETDDLTQHIDKKLALRVYSLPKLSDLAGTMSLSFDIPVSGFQGQQKVQLPMAASAYSAVIGEINADNSFSALVTSDTIQVPRASPVSVDEPEPDHAGLIAQFMENNGANDNKSATEHIADNSQDTSESTITVNVISDTEKSAELKAEDEPSDSFILQDFKGYGYDLKIYRKGLDSESMTVLSKPEATVCKNPSHTNTPDKNISGLGRLL